MRCPHRHPSCSSEALEFCSMRCALRAHAAYFLYLVPPSPLAFLSPLASDWYGGGAVPPKACTVRRRRRRLAACQVGGAAPSPHPSCSCSSSPTFGFLFRLTFLLPLASDFARGVRWGHRTYYICHSLILDLILFGMQRLLFWRSILQFYNS